MTSLTSAAYAALPSSTPTAKQPAQGAGAAAGSNEAGGDKAVSSSFAGGDFETFLRMLTTQIRNQDPMSPMESSDFAVQLATFSGVEQQVRTNQLLESLNVQRQDGLGSVAGWIGKEVRTVGSVAKGFGPVKLAIEPANGATSVQLVALDSFGRETARQTLPATAGEMTWNGLGNDGRELNNGLYSFKLVSLKGEDILGTDAVGAYARVTGAELTGSGLRLTLPGGASALEGQVTALRDPA